LDHVELPGLTSAAVAEYLQHEGVHADDLGNPTDALAGFVFVAGRAGWAFVNAADPLPRRRFTAAHELGHFMLHRSTMGRFRADTDATLCEAGDDAADRMEQEANRFAAELLMPAEMCRTRASEFRQKHGCCPRGVLVYRLASEFLVSREAMRYRLQALEVGDE
jgi:Zn-dependent peptidase ImmA (M78 family)